MKRIRVFSPATVANVSCGFDVMGFALDTLGDTMVFTKTDNPEVKITKITGAKLPYDSNKNVVGVVANLLLEKSNSNFGLEIEITKSFMPGSGLGSSAASAAGAAFGVNQFLKKPYNNLELTKFAMQGEVVACGSAIADNVAATLYGGFVLIRSKEPLDVVSIPTPTDLIAVLIHPQIEIRTEDARKVLPQFIPLKTATEQWANVGGLVSGLYQSDYKAIGNALVDKVAEPVRKHFIPLFDEVKNKALNVGALGFGISGSGPSMFALCQGNSIADKVAIAMASVYNETDIEYKLFISQIGNKGTRLL